jgi:5,10-methylene-tetrahydrofolate dehydrogenase/methenyl tetrahydrofolate cyclohydrolase
VIVKTNHKKFFWVAAFFIIAITNFAHTQETQSHVKRAIVIGATSGMGRQVAKLLASE